MKLTDLQYKYQNFADVVKITDFEHLFNIYESGNDLKYNLNSTLYFNNIEGNSKLFRVQHDMQWPLISHQIYDTTRLAWLLMKLNDVKPNDVFKTVKAGSVVKFLDQETVQNIIRGIRES